MNTRVRRHLLATIAAAIIATAAPNARACIWDRDTERIEIQHSDRVLGAAIDYYDRFPPKYYEMRLARIAAQPTVSLSDCDDAGVACDRLGRAEDAIAWMARKRAMLEVLPPSAERTTHEYRHLANLGTFYAHRWVQSGADPLDRADLQRGRDLIAEAIRLNPEAHYGREVQQLQTLDWLLALPVSADLPYGPLAGDVRGPQVADSLAGLMIQGSASRSFDVWLAMASNLADGRDTMMARAVALRMEALLDAGELRSLHPAARTPEDMQRIIDSIPAVAESRGADRMLRAWLSESVEVSAERTRLRDEHLARMFAVGQHPDTHPDVWALAPTGPRLPQLPGMRDQLRLATQEAVVWVIACAGLVLVPLTLSMLFRRREQLRRLRPVEVRVR